VGLDRSGRDPGGRVRLRDHGRLTWTLPSAGGRSTPGVETGENRPLCLLVMRRRGRFAVLGHIAINSATWSRGGAQ